MSPGFTRSYVLIGLSIGAPILGEPRGTIKISEEMVEPLVLISDDVALEERSLICEEDIAPEVGTERLAPERSMAAALTIGASIIDFFPYRCVVELLILALVERISILTLLAITQGDISWR